MGDIQSIARLLGILAEAGYDLAEILEEARDNGDISPETWEMIRNDIANAGSAWESGGGGVF